MSPYIDMSIFQSLLALDEDDEDQTFTREILREYFQQSDDVIGQMKAAVVAADVNNIAQLGHFLKGSSSSIGAKTMKDLCEILQTSKNLSVQKGIVEQLPNTLLHTKQAYDLLII